LIPDAQTDKPISPAISSDNYRTWVILFIPQLKKRPSELIKSSAAVLIFWPQKGFFWWLSSFPRSEPVIIKLVTSEVTSKWNNRRVRERLRWVSVPLPYRMITRWKEPRSDQYNFLVLVWWYRGRGSGKVRCIGLCYIHHTIHILYISFCFHKSKKMSTMNECLCTRIDHAEQQQPGIAKNNERIEFKKGAIFHSIHLYLVYMSYVLYWLDIVWGLNCLFRGARHRGSHYIYAHCGQTDVMYTDYQQMDITARLPVVNIHL
jgi:hypothetical protein